MINKVKEFLTRQAQDTNNSVRGTIMAMVGGYVVYLAVEMLLTALKGDTAMSLGLTVVLAALMGVAGVLVCALGAYIFYVGWQREKAAEPPQEDRDRQA